MAHDSDQNVDWQSLYWALLRDLGLDPEAFQLIYPYTSWNWPTANLGYTTAPQHDFCATMPLWSLTGAYASSGTRFNDSYGMFLSVLETFSTDPELQQQIHAQQQVVQEAGNAYQTAYLQASREYEVQTGGLNEPLFTDWLASDGTWWARKLDRSWREYEGQYAVLLELIEKSETPGLQAALARLADRTYYTRYQEPTLADFPLVPGYTIATTPSEWVQDIHAGHGVPGTVHVVLHEETGTEDDSPATWTDRFLPVPYPFFGTTVDGTQRPLVIPRTGASEVEITLRFEAWTTVAIEADRWFDGEFLCRRRNGPFIPGFSGDRHDGDVYMWGEGGAVNLRKSALLAAYNPTFEIAGDPASPAFQHLERSCCDADEIRVGPFRGRLDSVSRPSRQEGRIVSTGPTTEVPMIFGVYVEVLPCGVEL